MIGFSSVRRLNMTPNLASSPYRNRRAVASFSLLLALVMMLAACGGGSSSTTTTNRATTLRVLSAPGQPNPNLFNPFFDTNQGGDFGAQGLLYETLYFTNLYNGQTTPWLASSNSYSADLTQLTFTLRPGVKQNSRHALTTPVLKSTFSLIKPTPDLL